MRNKNNIKLTNKTFYLVFISFFKKINNLLYRVW